MRTPRGAHYGLMGWLYQRVSAVVMLGSAAVFAFLALTRAPGFSGWQSLMSQPLARITALLFFAMLYVHVWTGMRNIVMDYVQSTSIKIILYTLIALSLFGYGVWTLEILA